MLKFRNISLSSSSNEDTNLIWKNLLSYRSLQLINSYYNDLNEMGINLFSSVGVITAQIVTMILFVNFNLHDGLFSFLFILMLWILAATIGRVLFGDAADVLKASDLVRCKLHAKFGRNKKKWVGKMIKSFTLISIRCAGVMYF